MADSQDNIFQEIPKGFCSCGCGQKTTIAKTSQTRTKKGDPYNYINGHHCRGPKNFRWNGGRKKTGGYILITMPDHPASQDGYVREHIFICEKALGKYLPTGAMPHHVNGKKDDNRNQNLVLCQDRAYHNLIERRTRAFKACDHGSWRKCHFCKQYDAPENLVIREPSKIYHLSCAATYARERRHKAKDR